MKEDTCVWAYNMNSDKMGRIMLPQCNAASWHGEIIAYVIDNYKYCPYCSKKITFKNEGK